MGTDLKCEIDVPFCIPIPVSTSNSPSLAFAALSLMGDVYWEKKDYIRSSLHYLASLAIQPLQQGQSIKQLLRVGQCYEKLGKTPEAIRSFSKAEDLAQKEKATSGQSLAEICLHLADCQYKIQEYTAALKTYQRVQSLSPKPEDRDWVLFQIGNCSLKKAEPKVAQDAFKKLKENNQDTIWPVVSDQWSEVQWSGEKTVVSVGEWELFLLSHSLTLSLSHILALSLFSVVSSQWCNRHSRPSRESSIKHRKIR